MKAIPQLTLVHQSNIKSIPGFSEASNIISVDPAGSSSFVVKKVIGENVDQRNYDHVLRLDSSSESGGVRQQAWLGSHYSLLDLEVKLRRLADQGVLKRTILYYGVQTDPFHPFDYKFQLSIKALRLFVRYRPGMLLIQTRSPLVVIALSSLKELSGSVIVTMGIETNLESVAARYTPGLPTVGERLRAISALHSFGVETAIQVAPLLPYGNQLKDAGAFADVIDSHASWIEVRPFSSFTTVKGRRDAYDTIARKLAADRRVEWLRADSADRLIESLQTRCPGKLAAHVRTHLSERQLSFLVA